MNCNICGSEHLKPIFEYTPGRKIFHCLDCDVQFLHPRLNEEELKLMYAEKYYLAWGIQGSAENMSTRLMKMDTFRLRMSLIRKFVETGNVLDVGCASGYFLEVAKEQGYTPYGVEFSEYSSDIAKKIFGDESIFHGTLEQCSFQEKMFDVIAMSDLIEHVNSPIETLSKAYSLLKNEGLIMIMTPDTSSLSNKIMGKKWSHYKLEHLYYFSPSSMKMLAEKCNMQILHEERSKKALNIEYLYTQFKVYHHWILSPLLNLLHFVLPKKIRTLNFHISLGEMLVILKKKSA